MKEKIRQQYLMILATGLFVVGMVSFGVSPIFANENVSAGEVKEVAKDIEQLDFAHGLFQRELYPMAIAEYEKFIKLFSDSPDLHEAYFAIGESLFFSKTYAEAIKAYMKYKILFPESSKKILTMLRLGQCYFFTGQYSQALSSFEAVTIDGLDKDFIQILYFYKGKTYKAQGEIAKAMEYFEKTESVLKTSKRTIHALLELGDMFAHEGKNFKAIDYYDRAYEVAETVDLKSLVLYKKGEAQFLTKNYTYAVKTFQEFLEKYADLAMAKDAFTNLILAQFNLAKYEALIESYQGYQGIVSEDQKFFSLRFTVASAYAELKRSDEALALLEKISAMPSLPAEDQQKILLKKAEVKVRAAQFEEALTLIKSNSLDATVDKAQLIFLEGEAHYGMKAFDSAFVAYQKLATEFPESKYAQDAIYGMAHAQNSLGKVKEAGDLFYQYFEKGEDEDKQKEALFNEILIHKELGNLQTAVAHSEMYLLTFPKDKRTEKVLFHLGGLYSAAKRHGMAVDILKRYEKEHSNSKRIEDVYFLLAYNLQLAEQPDEALTYYEKITPQENDTKRYYSSLKNRGLIYLNQKKDDEAIKIFDKIITDFDKADLDINTYLWITDVYLGEKQFDDVLRILGKVNQGEQSEDVIMQIAYLRAEAYKGLMQYADAVEYYDIVLSSSEVGIKGGAAHIGKGESLIKMNELDKARQEFDAALLDYAEDTTIAMRARFEIANVEHMKGNPEEATKYYMLVAVLYGDEYYCPESLFRAGEIFEQLQKNDEALKVFTEILSMYEKSHVAEQAKGKVKSLSEE